MILTILSSIGSGIWAIITFVGLLIFGQFINDNLGSLKFSVIKPKIQFFFTILSTGGLIGVYFLMRLRLHKIGAIKLTKETAFGMIAVLFVLIILRAFKKGSFVVQINPKPLLLPASPNVIYLPAGKPKE